MSEMQAETQPVPKLEAAPTRRPRRAGADPAVAAEASAEAARPVGGEGSTAPTDETPGSDTAPAGALAEVAPEAAPAAAAPPAPARRTPRRPTVIEALGLAQPGVRTAEILAELDRRQRRAETLLAERERVIAAMGEIEAVLDTIAQQ